MHRAVYAFVLLATICAADQLPPVFQGRFVPGTYQIGAAAVANYPVQLDCQNNNNANFLFIVGGALAFNANALRINGNCNVKWQVDGAAAINSGFSVDGDITAVGAINILANAHLSGCAQAGGALNYGTGGTSGPCSQKSSFRKSSVDDNSYDCPIGNAAPGCMPCPIGSYALASQRHCTKCPQGFSCPIASVGPDACYPLANDDDDTSSGNDNSYNCPIGNAAPGCMPCPIGSYALASQRHCTQCPQGYSSPIASVGPDACYPLSSAANLNSRKFKVAGADHTLSATFQGRFTPGTYSIGAAAAANEDVELDCSGGGDFHFIIGGALSMNANALRTNGACAVTWSVDGAASIAAGFTVDGDINASGAINILANSRLNGCARAGGALTYGAGGSSGSCSQLSQRRLVHGRSLSSPRLPPFGVNKAELYTDLQSRQCDTVLDADFGGQTLTSGVYCISAAGTISQNVILDAENDNSAVFIFKFGAAFNTVATRDILIINGSAQVFYATAAAATLGANSHIPGTVVAYMAVTLGANAAIGGQAFSVTGAAITLGAGATIGRDSR